MTRAGNISKAQAKVKKAQALKARAVRKAQAEVAKEQAKARKAQARARKARMVRFSKEVVVKDIMKEALTLGIANATTERYAKSVAKKIAKWVEGRNEVLKEDAGMRAAGGGIGVQVTKEELDAQIAKEIAKYNRDIAFIYRNRGRII